MNNFSKQRTYLSTLAKATSEQALIEASFINDINDKVQAASPTEYYIVMHSFINTVNALLIKAFMANDSMMIKIAKHNLSILTVIMFNNGQDFDIIPAIIQNRGE